MHLIAGLGNPGEEYLRSRHNAGFMLIDRLAKAWDIELAKKRLFKAFVGRGFFNGIEVMICKPLTFMNLSGYTVGALAKQFSVAPENVIVAHDDAALPLGAVRIRQGGSSFGGHNGLKSVAASLAGASFTRLRLGIGARPNEIPALRDYVLGDFRSAEIKEFSAALEKAAGAVEQILGKGPAAAMNVYNVKSDKLEE